MANSNSITPLPLGEGPGVRAAGVRIAVNPYTQVALTYVRHIGASGVTGFVVAALTLMAFVFLGAVIAGSDTKHDAFLLLIVVVTVLSFWSMIVAHAREQFADSRAHLMPNFRRAHIVVVVILALIIVLLLPATFAWLAGFRSICPVALAMFFCGAELPQPRWLKVLGPTSWFALILLFIALGRVAPEKLFSAQLLSSGKLELPALVVLILGAAMTLRGRIRLTWLNEDMPDYHHPINSGWTTSRKSSNQREAGEAWFQGARDWLAERHAAGLTRHAHRANTSRWSRVCRWQAGMSTGWSVWFWSVGLILPFQAWTWFLAAHPCGSVLLGYLLVFFPFFNSVMRWNERTPTLARELLMPVTRSGYLRQLGAAAALNQLQLWAAMSSVGIVCWLIAGKEKPQFAVIANLLVISGLSQIWLFGMVVWWTRCRSMILGMVVGVLVIAEPLLLIGVAGTEPLAEWRYASWLAAGLFAILGVLLLRNAYRRWWLTELDFVKM
jgi:hypothetical protein